MADPTSQSTDLPDDTIEASADAPGEPSRDDTSTPSVPAAQERSISRAVAIASGEAHDDLLGELARAMHLAASSQYERMNAELEKRRVEQVEAIAIRASSEVERLNSGSESDIESIEDWARAETEKIKVERARRIEARRDQLATELGRQDTIREREVSAVDVAIAGYRTEIDRFFGRMEREHDPAEIAKVAATMPALPPLAQIADDARLAAVAEFTEQEATTEATTEATAIADTAASVEAAAEVAPGAMAEAEPVTGELEPVVETAPVEAVSESRLMGVMDPDSMRSDAPSREWEQPAAVSVAAGSPMPEAHQETSPRGSSLLRTVRAIRPMSDHKERDS